MAQMTRMILMLVLLGGCAGQDAAQDTPQADACGAAGLQHLLDHPLPAGIATADRLRVYETGSPLTMDFHTDRLNIELSPQDGRVVAVWCG